MKLLYLYVYMMDIINIYIYIWWIEMEWLFIFSDFSSGWSHYRLELLNTLRPKQNGRRFPDDMILKIIFLNENMWISIKI